MFSFAKALDETRHSSTTFQLWLPAKAGEERHAYGTEAGIQAFLHAHLQQAGQTRGMVVNFDILPQEAAPARQKTKTLVVSLRRRQ